MRVQFLPIVDGPDGTIDGQFNDLLSSGTLPNRVPFVVRVPAALVREDADGIWQIGTVHDEGQLFTDSVITQTLGNEMATFDALLPQVFSRADAQTLIATGALTVNASDSDGVRTALANVVRE